MPQKLTPHLMVGQNDRPPKLGGLIEAGGGKFSGAGRRRLLELVHAGKELLAVHRATPHDKRSVSERSHRSNVMWRTSLNRPTRVRPGKTANSKRTWEWRLRRKPWVLSASA
jgi:hypothetical protein